MWPSVIFFTLCFAGVFVAATYWRPQGMWRAARAVVLASIIAIAVIPVGGGVSPGQLAFIYGIATPTAIVALRRHRKAALLTRPPRRAIQWGHYVVGVSLVLYCHGFLAFLAHYLRDAEAQDHHEGQLTTAQHISIVVAIPVLTFAFSQVTFARVLSGLHRALSEDWELSEEDPLRRRWLVFWLGAGPILLCLVPSLVFQSLVLSVLLRFALLLQARRLSERAPREHEAEFLTWGYREVFLRSRLLRESSKRTG